jgi:hypothetical protein
MADKANLSGSLIRCSGVAAILVGILTAAFWFIHPDATLTNVSARLSPMWTPVYAVFLLVLVLYLFSLMGLFSKQMGKIGYLGAIGFVLAIAGTALLIGAGAFDGFVTPALAASSSTVGLLAQDSALTAAVLPLFVLAGITFLIGNVLFGLAIFLAKVLPKWTGVLLIISAPILGLSPLMPAEARMAGSVVFGLTNIWLGWVLLKNKQ